MRIIEIEGREGRYLMGRNGTIYTMEGTEIGHVHPDLLQRL